MDMLITGGSEGIGHGLAARGLAAGGRVLVTGRSAAKLEAAARELPGLMTAVSDIGDPAQREALAAHVHDVLPELDLLVNNAGLQRRVALAADEAPWAERQAELDVLLAGPVHLNHLLLPVMLAHGRPSRIVNVTSGGAYVPQVFAPLYSACKAALHAYTVTLRHALAGTPCRVIELIPPAVQTHLAGGTAHGVPLEAFCDAIFPALTLGDQDEVGYGPTPGLARAWHAAFDAAFAGSAARFEVETYASKNPRHLGGG